MTEAAHKPVMLDRVLAAIAPRDGAIYVDGTFGAGGYSRAIASYNDGEGSGKTAVRVSPRVGQPPPVNSAPAFPASERGTREIPEDATGGTAVGDPVAAMDFNNDTLRYTLSGTDAALFTIGSNDGQLLVASGAELDFETKRTLRVTVEVTDGANALGDPDEDAIDDRQSVTITLTDVNEAPTVSGDATPSFEENSDRPIATYTGTDPERGTLSWSVDNDDDFFITQSGQLYFASPPNYEDQTSYLVTITATDDDPIVSLSGSLSITVTVTDVEEPGVVTITPLRGWIGTRFEAELTDGDGSVTREAWKWERSRNRSSWEEITGASEDNYTADADDVGHFLRAAVSYSDRRGGNKEAAAETRSLIGEAQPTTTNNAPGFDEASTTRSIRQGAGKGRPVGAPVKADDPDQGEMLTYELQGTDEEHFTIVPGGVPVNRVGTTWGSNEYGLVGSVEWTAGRYDADLFVSYTPSYENDRTGTCLKVVGRCERLYSSRPSMTVDSYTTVDLTVSYLFEHGLRLRGGGRNVLDADPLAGIGNTRRIADVYLRGARVDRPALRAGWAE